MLQSVPNCFLVLLPTKILLKHFANAAMGLIRGSLRSTLLLLENRFLPDVRKSPFPGGDHFLIHSAVPKTKFVKRSDPTHPAKRETKETPSAHKTSFVAGALSENLFSSPPCFTTKIKKSRSPSYHNSQFTVDFETKSFQESSRRDLDPLISIVTS